MVNRTKPGLNSLHIDYAECRFADMRPLAPGAMSRPAETAPFPEKKTTIEALRLLNTETITFSGQALCYVREVLNNVSLSDANAFRDLFSGQMVVFENLNNSLPYGNCTVGIHPVVNVTVGQAIP